MRAKIYLFIVIGLLSQLEVTRLSSVSDEQADIQQQSQYHKYLWGTYRPDLLYEYNTIGNEGLAFGIIYHSNKGLDLEKIERCPVLNNQQGNGKGGNSAQNQGFYQKQRNNGGKVDKCRSIPAEYEKQLRYELDQNNEQLKAEYKLHDGSSYVQELIEEQNEILMNIKTLKTSFSSLDEQSWSTFINTQRSLPKKQSPADNLADSVFNTQQSEQLTDEQINLNHSDTLQYTASNRQTMKQVRVVDCLESIKLLNTASEESGNQNQQKLYIKVANSGGMFVIEDIKNQEGFRFEYRLVQEQQLNFRSNGRGGNMRRILQSDLVNFKDAEQIVSQYENPQNQKGNILFIKANVKNISKSIFRISYDSKNREPVSQNDLIVQMKTAENNFLHQVQQRILSSYKEVPKPIVQISSYALSNILGSLFFVADTSFFTETVAQEQQNASQTLNSQSQYTCISQQYPFFMSQQSIYQSQQTQPNLANISNQKLFYAQKEIFGISTSRVGGNLTPSLYNDGYTLSVIAEWDKQLAEMILSNWIAHRNVEGLSYLDNQNVLKIISTSFASIHIRQLSQSAPSIIFTINKLFNKYFVQLKNLISNYSNKEEIESYKQELQHSVNFERALELYDFAEDILFNMLFSSQDNFKHSHKKGNHHHHHKKSQNQKKENRLEHLKWTLDEFTNMYTSSGLDDLVRHKFSSEELVSSVDYLSWSIFLCQSLVDMASKLSRISPDLLDEKQQYQEVSQTLQQMLVDQLQDQNNFFKDKLQQQFSPNHTHNPPYLSPSISCMNTYPFIFDAYSILNNGEEEANNSDDDERLNHQKPLKQSVQDDVNLNLLTIDLNTPFGIASSNSTLSFDQIKSQNQNSNTNKLSLKGCYETGEISLIQNYLVLRKLFKVGQHDEHVKKQYRQIYNNLLENIIKNYEDFSEIYEVYTKADGKLFKKCRQIPAHSVFLLLLNEDYQ